MKINVNDIKTWAKGNGVPCRGDEYEGIYNGDTYRAEFYGEKSMRSNYIAVYLAAESPIEKKVGNTWESVKFSDYDDELFNEIVNAIRPDVEY